jgi:hypothetical protein
MENKYSTKIIIFCIFSLFCLASYAQPAFTDETVLWVCPADASLKITYRMNNYANEIEINGPFNMPANKSVSGVLKISNGSFEQPKQLTPNEVSQAAMGNYKSKETLPVQSKELTISERYYSKSYFYYGTDKQPTVTFEGSCTNAEDLKNVWSEWKSLWKSDKDTLEVLYRTMSYVDPTTNKDKSKLEIKGPENYLKGEFNFLGKLTINNDIAIKSDNCSSDFCNNFSITQNSPTCIKVFNILKINTVSCSMQGKSYSKDKKVRIKAKIVSDTRG